MVSLSGLMCLSSLRNLIPLKVEARFDIGPPLLIFVDSNLFKHIKPLNLFKLQAFLNCSTNCSAIPKLVLEESRARRSCPPTSQAI